MAFCWSRGRTTLGAIAAVVLSLTGCVGGGGKSSEDATAECASAPGVTPESVTVGYIYPDTGSFAPVFVPARGAVEARIARQNEDGGVNGRQILLEWRDDASDLSNNEAAARELVENERVLAILQTTATASASATYLDDSGVPTVGIATDLSWAEHQNMFAHAYVYTAGESVSTFGDYVSQQGGTSAFLVEDFTDTASVLSRGLATSVQSRNIPIVGRRSFSAAGESPESVVEEIKASGADVLLGGLPGPSFAPIVEEVRRQRLPLKVVLGISGYDQDLLDRYDPALAGMSVYIPYIPFEIEAPALDTYRQVLARYAPQLPTPDREAAIQSYISADLLVKGLEAAGVCPTRDSFLINLRALKGYDGAGLLPSPIDLDASFGVLASCYYFVKVDESGSHFLPQRRPGATDDVWCGNGVPPGTPSVTGETGGTSQPE